MTQETIATDENGKCLKTGRFVKGHKKIGNMGGRPKGSRNKMTQAMLDRIHYISEEGISPEDVLMQIYKDKTLPPDLRLKAASKVADIVYPRASSVQMNVESAESMSPNQIQDKIREMLAAAQMRESMEGQRYDT